MRRRAADEAEEWGNEVRVSRAVEWAMLQEIACELLRSKVVDEVEVLEVVAFKAWRRKREGHRSNLNKHSADPKEER